jgi:hypothetical protein
MLSFRTVCIRYNCSADTFQRCEHSPVSSTLTPRRTGDPLVSPARGSAQLASSEGRSQLPSAGTALAKTTEPRATAGDWEPAPFFQQRGATDLSPPLRENNKWAGTRRPCVAVVSVASSSAGYPIALVLLLMLSHQSSFCFLLFISTNKSKAKEHERFDFLSGGGGGGGSGTRGRQFLTVISGCNFTSALLAVFSPRPL